MKNRAESFEDIIFENRNKDYGAYELRKRYPKRGTIALIISITILFFGFGMPLIANMMKQRAVRNLLENNTVISLEKVDKKVEKITPPPPPPPPAPSIKEIKFKAPVIVDSVTVETDLIDLTDCDFNSNPPVDTTTQRIEVTKVEKNDLPEEIVNIIDVTEPPIYPEGESALIKYVAEHTVYPQPAIDGEIEGTVYIRFVVTKTGHIGEAKVYRKVDPLLDNEALRVIKLLPKWTPGKINGYPVNVWFIMPVKFKLQKGIN
jgi:periplasmic protein TonB